MTSQLDLDMSKDCHLVIGPNWIGDAAMAAPFLASLESAFPSSRIEVVANSWTARLFQGFPWVNKVHSFGDRIHQWKAVFAVRRKLSEKPPETIWLLPNSFRAAVIGICIGRRGRRVGYATGGRGFLLSHAVKPPSESPPPHLIDYYLGLLEAEGYPDVQRQVQISATPEAKRFAEEVFSKKIPSGDGPLIGFHPGAAFGESKTWSADSFARLAKGLAKSLGARVVIFGGKAEIPLARRVVEASDEAAISIAGEDTLETLPGVLEGLDLFVSGDTGPLHIAALVGTRTLSLFGPTDPRRTAPRGSRHSIIRRELDCSPCFERICPLGHHKCMKNITSEEVEEEVKKILGAGVGASE